MKRLNLRAKFHRTTKLVLSAVAVCLFGLSAQAEMAVVLEEDFSACMYSGSTIWTTIGAAGGTALSGFPTTVLPGWTGMVTSVYGAFATNSVGVTNCMVKLGAGGVKGWIETPKMNLTGGQGDFTVVFRAGAWASDSTTLYVEHHTASGSETIATVSPSDIEMQEYKAHGTNGTENSSICFIARIATNNRFFLDDVRVENEQSTKRVTITQAVTNVLAGQVASAVVTANESDAPVPVAVEDTNFPLGNPPSFDGTNFSWTPQETGEFWVRFVASNATDRIFHIMTISVGLPAPAAPAVETSAGSIFLSWAPVPGATGYSVQAYQLAAEQELFAENFQACTNRSSLSGTVFGAATQQSMTNRFSEFGLANWMGDSVYCAFASNAVNNVTNYMVKFSTQTSTGWLQTPPLNLSANGGKCTLTFHAANWGIDKGTIDVLHITDSGKTTNTLETITGLSATTLTKCTVAVTGGTTSSVICFKAVETSSSSSYNRFFLDDVRLFYVMAARIEISPAQTVVSGTTARIFGLSSLSEYLCTVTATDGVSETVSPEVMARTTSSTVIILR